MRWNSDLGGCYFDSDIPCHILKEGLFAEGSVFTISGWRGSVFKSSKVGTRVMRRGLC